MIFRRSFTTGGVSEKSSAAWIYRKLRSWWLMSQRIGIFHKIFKH